MERGLELRLLAGLQVRDGERVILDRSWNRSKAKALIKLLALHPGRSLHREQVLEALWPRMEQSAAANNLHKNLHYVREMCAASGIGGSFVLSDDGGVRIAPNVRIDIDEFQRTAAEAQATRTDPTLYERAISLYGGDLLPEDMLEDWTSGPRDTLREQYCTLLSDLASLQEARGQYAKSIEALRRLLQTDPSREEAHAGLMRAYALTGDRDGARRQFAACRAALEREIGVQPMKETVRLYESIVDGSFAATPVGVRAPDGALIGRAGELRRLRDALDSAVRGQAGIVLLAGEPGIGKTRLTEELAMYARLRGVHVLWGRCHEGQPTAFGPWIEALRSAMRHRPEGASDPIANLSRSVPRGATEPARSSSGVRRERNTLFEEMLGFVRAASKRQPLLLIVEDVHDADAASVALLEYVVRELRDDRLLILASYRDGAVRRPHPLADALGALMRERVKERLQLQGIAREHAREFVSSVAGVDPSARAVDAVHGETNGNPFFMKELVRLVQSEEPAGALRSNDVRIRVPASVREVIDRRLHRLSAQCRETLRAAAVAGIDFDAATAREIANVPAEMISASLEEAAAAGMAAPTQHASDRYVLSHALVRQAIYESVPAPRRALLHRRAAAWTAQGTPHDAALLARLAQHLVAAATIDGETQDAIDAAIRAGDAARRIFAWEDAVRMWKDALRLMDASAAPPAQIAGLLERVGDLIINTFDDYPSGLAYLERAVKIRDELGDLDRAAEIRLRLGLALSTDTGNPEHTKHMDIARALDHYRAAERTIGTGEPSRALAYFYVGLANASFYRLRVGEGLQASARAMEIGREIGHESVFASGAMLHGVLLKISGRMSEGVAVMQEAGEIADRQNDTLLAYYITTNVADWQEGYACGRGALLEREIAQPRIANAPTQRRGLQEDLMSALCLNGRVAEARHIAAETDTRQTRAMMKYCEGAWGEAESLWREGYQDLLRSGNISSFVSRSQHIAWACYPQSKLREMERLTREELELANDGGAQFVEVRALVTLALALALTARDAEARTLLERARIILANGEDWGAHAIKLALAEAACSAAAADIESAAMQFGRAARIAAERVMRWDEAESYHLWGRALAASGDSLAASAKLDAAAAVYREIGAGEPWLLRLRPDA